MYFPLGAPSVYSHDLPSRPRDANQFLQDGLFDQQNASTAELVPGLGPPTDAPIQDSSASAQEQASVRPRVQDGQACGDHKQREHSLIGMQASRSGHVFATISSDTITVWQTKV